MERRLVDQPQPIRIILSHHSECITQRLPLTTQALRLEHIRCTVVGHLAPGQQILICIRVIDQGWDPLACITIRDYVESKANTAVVGDQVLLDVD